MKVLELVVKRHWFSKIISGHKKEEYRDCKEYWASRICEDSKVTTHNFKKFDAVRFRAGYAKDAPVMLVEHILTRIGIGDCALGASREPQYIIHLGDILDIKNYNATDPDHAAARRYADGLNKEIDVI